MMAQNKLKTSYGRFDDHAVVQLPYKGQEVVMLVVLPNENSTNALSSISSEASLKKVIQDSRLLQQTDVNVKLPRFKFEFGLELSDMLQEMGIRKPFAPDADFSPMVSPGSPPGRLMISQVFHKAFVEVNEEGTEAAAATAIVMDRCRPPPSVDFVVNRPFVFIIYNTRLQCPLFVGKVVYPTA